MSTNWRKEIKRRISGDLSHCYPWPIQPNSIRAAREHLICIAYTVLPFDNGVAQIACARFDRELKKIGASLSACTLNK